MDFAPPLSPLPPKVTTYALRGVSTRYDACMTSDGLFRPRKLAELTPENLRVLIEDMGGPGYYTSADLYRWYVSMAEEQGLEPVTRQKFSLTLKQLGYRSSVRRVCGQPARCWLITRRAVRTPLETSGTVPEMPSTPYHGAHG